MYDNENPTDETLDAILAGKLKLIQSRSGYRFSLDSILLAHFPVVRDRDVVADLGSGNGVIALLLAFLHPGIAVTGLEAQAAMVERARRNVALNNLEDRVTIVREDVCEVRARFAPETFSLVVSNPPYRRPSSGRISRNPEKQQARHEIRGRLADFLSAAAYLLPPKGRSALVYPAVRAVDLLAAMRHAGIEPKRLRWVHSRDQSDATMVLVEGVKAGRSGLRVLPALYVYDAAGRYTPEVAAMLRLDPRRGASGDL